MEQPTSADPSEDSLWEQARNLTSSKEDPDTIVDQDSLSQTVVSMEKIFSQHKGSQNCVVCNSMEDLPTSGELDIGRLKYNFESVTQSEKETVVKHHFTPPESLMRVQLGRSSIEKVEFVLEKREHWSAIRLQEFRKDEKALRVGPRRPFLSTGQHLGDALGRDQPLAEDPGDRASSALVELERSLETALETPLRREYRQNAKDVCVLVPFKKGKRCCAREVTERVDAELIKLWLSRCEKKHSLCSRRNKVSYPPGLILIDAERM